MNFEWIIDAKPNAGVAYGNVKTHKNNSFIMHAKGYMCAQFHVCHGKCTISSQLCTICLNYEYFLLRPCLHKFTSLPINSFSPTLSVTT